MDAKLIEMHEALAKLQSMDDCGSKSGNEAAWEAMRQAEHELRSKMFRNPIADLEQRIQKLEASADAMRKIMQGLLDALIEACGRKGA